MMQVQQTPTASNAFVRIERVLFAKKEETERRPGVPSLSEVWREIEECLALEPDWDGEDALPVAPETANMVRNLVKEISCGLQVSGAWRTPSLSPDPNGRLHLLWRLEAQRLLLIVDGSRPETVITVVTRPDVEPIRNVISFRDAVQQVQTALNKK